MADQFTSGADCIPDERIHDLAGARGSKTLIWIHELILDLCACLSESDNVIAYYAHVPSTYLVNISIKILYCERITDK